MNIKLLNALKRFIVALNNTTGGWDELTVTVSRGNEHIPLSAAQLLVNHKLVRIDAGTVKHHTKKLHWGKHTGGIGSYYTGK